MNLFYLAVTQEGLTINPDFTARLRVAAEVLLRGMLTVFAVLCIIWLFLAVIRLFTYDLPRRRKEKAASEAQAVAIPVQEAEEDDGELIAVITAAIAASAEEGSSFRVVSFKRIH